MSENPSQISQDGSQPRKTNKTALIVWVVFAIVAAKFAVGAFHAFAH